MAVYYVCYRVNSGSSSDNQYEKVNGSGQTKVKELIQAKYPGSKITWVNSPTSSSNPPSWYKG